MRLRVELGPKSLENFFPVLVKSEAATWCETDHVA